MLNRLAISRCQQAFSKPCLVNLISEDTHLVFSIKLPHKLNTRRQIDFYIKFNTIKSKWSIVYIDGSQVITFKKKIIKFLSVKTDWQTVQTLMKCCILQHFICVFTVCKSTHLGLCHLQRVTSKANMSFTLVYKYKSHTHPFNN